MSIPGSSNEQAASLERLLNALKLARTQLEATEFRKTEPIAIIGMGCRFPFDAKNPQDFWQLLHDGVDAIREIPKERWDIDSYYHPDPDVPGKMYTRYGGFISEVDTFDSQFFGISPREAECMDPQQRLLLEVTWEAIENAGLPTDKLQGSSTGLFIGISFDDYSRLSVNSGDATRIDAYSSLGNSRSIAVGRLAYILGVHGPAMQLDTSCSSSLLGIHLACQSLRQRECNLALAGGVNLMLSPEITIGFSKLKALAADGRCKTFDASADGYARGEGCGIIVLKRLSDAKADGDNILALIRGSAVNHDGRSNGLTAPNGSAQEAVIRQALENAKVKPEQIQYVEAHGTGTSLGDPIEVLALSKVLGQNRSKNEALYIGSVKTNFGHLESASGVAGIMKVVLSLQNKKIPPSLHFQKPNPYIPWEKIPITVPTEPIPCDSFKFAGVSSFGMSGTNVHVVLEAAPQNTATKPESERPLHLLTLSAKTDKALRELLLRYEAFLSNNSVTLADVCFTANTGRAQFQHRLAVLAASQQELRTKLSQVKLGELSPGVFQKQLPNSASIPKIAFLFTGQGSQYVNMGRQLYETQPVFRQALDKCQQILSSYLDQPLLSLLYPTQASQNPNQQILDETGYTQPAVFAIEYALFQLWQSWGIKPEVVLGHSVGEYVAACVAGVFSLEDALKLIAKRGKFMQQLPPTGEMVAVMAGADLIHSLIQAHTSQVAIAAYNGPYSTVISGATTAIRAICDCLSEKGIKFKKLEVSHAFHSPLMQPMLADFEVIANQVTYNRPQIALISNLTGQKADDRISTPQYWLNHILQPVRFADSIACLHQLGYETYLEIGPRPILLGMARQCLPEDFGVWLPSIRPGVEDWQQILQSLAQLYLQGAVVDWSGFDADYGRTKVVLPTYPFQRERYWVEPPRLPLAITSKSKSHTHPLLGTRLNFPGAKEIRFESRITKDFPAYLDHHRIYGSVVFLGAGYLEMALAAGVSVFKSRNLLLEEVNFISALVLPENSEEKILHLVLNLEASGVAAWQIFSVMPEDANDQSSWVLHANGKIISQLQETPQVDIETLKAKFNTESTQNFYDKMLDFAYGPLLRNMEQVWQSEGETLSKIKLQHALLSEVEDYVLHPALLDSCFQTMFTLFNKEDVSYEAPYVPIGCKTLKIYSNPSTHLWTYAKLYPTNNSDTQTLTADVHLYSLDGKLIASVLGLQAKKITSKALFGSQQQTLANLLYEVEWKTRSRFGRNLLSAPLLSPVDVKHKLASTISVLDSQPDLDNYGEILIELEKLSIDYVIKAFQQMGWTYQVGDTFSTESAAQRLGVVKRHWRLFNRLLQMLAEVGILHFTQQWKVLSTLSNVNPEQKSKNLLHQYPKAKAEITLLNRCADQLGNVLHGTLDPMELVFPQGDLTAATQLYQESPVPKVMNTLVGQAITTCLEKLPPEQGVRLLEIGAGTGGTTSYILPHLNPSQTEYVFTDISTSFTTKAKDKFRDYPFISYQTLDIEQNPANQGFEPHQYDVIVAANVLHATKSITQTITHVQQLLAPGGMLVLFEGTTPQRWLDLIFGLLEGWWKFNDFDLRPDYPLLSASKWQQFLSKSGLEQVVTIPEAENTQRVLSQQTVVIAQKNKDAIFPSHPLVSPSDARRWLILADELLIAQQLATQLRSQGDVCTLVFAAHEYQQVSKEEFTINPNNPEEFQRLVNKITEKEGNLYGVVQCWSLSPASCENLSSSELEALSQLGCGTTLFLLQALVKAELSKPPRLWLVTSGAQPVPTNHPAISAIGQSSLWGMGKVIALEHPEFKCVRIDLDPNQKVEAQATNLLAEICSQDIEDQVAFRQGNRYVARLVGSSHSKEDINPPLTFREESTYLITGGLGDLGLLVARWMVSKGAKNLVLVGRSDASHSAKSKLRELEQAGATIVLASRDVSKLESIAGVLSDINKSLPPLAGVIHSVGVLEDGVLQQQNWSKFTNVMNPKVQGAWHLHQLTKNQPLDFFVMFSSVASLFGSSGQGNHSAANAFLDALAYYRRGIGLPGLSINLGAVSQIGAAAKRQADVLVQKKGIGTITPQQVLDALELLMSTDAVEVGVVPIEWSTTLPQYNGWPFFSEWKKTDQLSFVSQSKFLQHLEAANKSERREILIVHLRQQVAQVLGLNPDNSISLEAGFFDLGMDSLTSMELRNRLQTSLGCSIPSTTAFDYPTIGDMVNYLIEQVLEFDVSEVKAENIEETNNPNEELDDLSQEEIASLLAAELSM